MLPPAGAVERGGSEQSGAASGALEHAAAATSAKIILRMTSSSRSSRRRGGELGERPHRDEAAQTERPILLVNPFGVCGRKRIIDGEHRDRCGLKTLQAGDVLIAAHLHRRKRRAPRWVIRRGGLAGVLRQASIAL